jgi:branched-chain amino acid transport system permease protein
MKKIFIWLAFILAIVLPSLAGQYILSILILICIWTIMSLSLNLIYGYTGQLSLGQSAFLGLGAYTFGLTAVNFHFGFWPALLCAVLVSAFFGLIIGYPALKTRGPYFILVTLGFSAIMSVVVLAWVNLTGGANGLSGMPRPDSIPLPGGRMIDFDSLLNMYYLILLFLILITLISKRLINSLIGKTFVAISHDENLSESLGINTARRKLLSFTISAMFAGVAGALYASFNSVISPELAHYTRSMDVVAYLMIGGAGTSIGPYIGTFVLVAIPEFLQVVPYMKTLINGILVLTFVIFLPNGIVGKAESLFRVKLKANECNER